MSRSAPSDQLTNEDARLARFWHPVARIDDLEAGKVRRVELLGRSLVVSRPVEGGTVLVAEDRCPHRAGRLSDGRIHNGCLVCPYHGWEFAPDGRCVTIPALGDGHPVPPTARLTGRPTATGLGLVWTHLGAGAPGASPTAALDPSLVWTWLPEVEVRCQAMHFVDNFCDIAHFPFVHGATFGADEDKVIDDLDVERTSSDTVVLRHNHVATNREDPLAQTGEHPLLQPRRMAYSWTAPFTCQLAIDLPLTGVHNTIIAVAAPTNRNVTTLYTALVRNDIATADEPAARQAVAYELSVLEEDIRILERLAEDSFPLDVTAQVHTRADRFGLEVRRVLVEMLGQTEPARPA